MSSYQYTDFSCVCVHGVRLCVCTCANVSSAPVSCMMVCKAPLSLATPTDTPLTNPVSVAVATSLSLTEKPTLDCGCGPPSHFTCAHTHTHTHTRGNTNLTFCASCYLKIHILDISEYHSFSTLQVDVLTCRMLKSEGEFAGLQSELWVNLQVFVGRVDDGSIPVHC